MSVQSRKRDRDSENATRAAPKGKDTVDCMINYGHQMRVKIIKQIHDATSGILPSQEMIQSVFQECINPSSGEEDPIPILYYFFRLIAYHPGVREKVKESFGENPDVFFHYVDEQMGLFSQGQYNAEQEVRLIQDARRQTFGSQYEAFTNEAKRLEDKRAADFCYVVMNICAMYNAMYGRFGATTG